MGVGLTERIGFQNPGYQQQTGLIGLSLAEGHREQKPDRDRSAIAAFLRSFISRHPRNAEILGY